MVVTLDLTSPSLPEEGPPLLEGVGFWLRALGRVIDLAVHMVVAILVGVAAAIVAIVSAALQGIPANEALAPISTTPVSAYVASMLGAAALHVVSEGLHGSTVGKRLCGLSVISDSGGPAGLVGALKRTVAFYVDALFFGFVAARKMSESPRRQRIGDIWGQTMVVRIADLDPGARRSSLRFVTVALAGMAADGLVMFAELVSRLAR